MLEHGGRLHRAARDYGIALADWLDLSTGINPVPYPVPDIPLSAWHRLPEDDDGLAAAAQDYYGTASLLAVAGSQPAIQALPQLIGGARVTLLSPTYAEHPHAWHERVLTTVSDCAADIEARIDDTDVLLLVHPNNPSGACFERAQLLDWHHRLATRDGWLVIDEAFIDCAPQHSLADQAGRPGLVVLRSIGKFFGLAGARAGFIMGPDDLLRALADKLGPWTLSGPTRHVVAAALRDQTWQAATRHVLSHAGTRLEQLLRQHGFDDPRGPALFKWVRHPDAAHIHREMAHRGILIRHFDRPPSLRFGLPSDSAGWQRLDAALAALNLKDTR